MQVSVDQLRRAADALFSHLEANGVKSIEITEEYYWDVPAPVRYDRYDEPTKHTIGQLSDDLAELQHLLNGTRPMVGGGLVWLAALLRRVGEKAEC
jgi:hypothetical protein